MSSCLLLSEIKKPTVSRVLVIFTKGGVRGNFIKIVVLSHLHYNACDFHFLPLVRVSGVLLDTIGVNELLVSWNDC